MVDSELITGDEPRRTQRVPLTTVSCRHFNKDGGYTYHHGPDVKITADPAKPIDKTWPALPSTNDGS
jgi:hypothetical protein